MPTDPNPATPEQQIDTFRTLERWLVCADGTTIEERAEAFAAAVRAVVTASKPEREVPSVARDEKARANVPDLNHANRHGTELTAPPPTELKPAIPPLVEGKATPKCPTCHTPAARAVTGRWFCRNTECPRPVSDSIGDIPTPTPPVVPPVRVGPDECVVTRADVTVAVDYLRRAGQFVLADRLAAAASSQPEVK